MPKDYISQERKKALFKAHSPHSVASDTGSAEAQIALFSHRIAHLTAHLKQNKKDYATELALLRLVGKRRRLLDYLSRTAITRYRAIVSKLGLRR